MQGITSMIDMCSVGEFKNELSTFLYFHTEISSTHSLHSTGGRAVISGLQKIKWTICTKKQKDAVNAKFS